MRGKWEESRLIYSLLVKLAWGVLQKCVETTLEYMYIIVNIYIYIFTLQGANISHPKAFFESMILLFQRLEYYFSSLEGIGTTPSFKDSPLSPSGWHETFGSGIPLPKPSLATIASWGRSNTRWFWGILYTCDPLALPAQYQCLSISKSTCFEN